IGTAQGGSLAQIAAHSGEVHSFDLVRPEELQVPDNVTLHTRDSHELLPRLLAELSEAGRNVGFVLVDGDHSADGVRRDLVDLISSPACGSTVVLIHDTMNAEARAGVEAAGLGGREEVAYLDLEFVPGRLPRKGPFRNQLWGGLGPAVVDREGAE